MLKSICKIVHILFLSCLATATFASNVKKISASTHENAQLAPNMVCDSNYNTRWSSHFKDNQWLIIELKKELKLDGLILFWETAFAKKFTVSTSCNGQTWQPAYETSASRGGVENINFSPRLARFIKLNLQERGTKYGFSIYEVVLKGPTLPKLQPPNHFDPKFWNDYFQILASESRKGLYPKFFLNRASYWVVAGIENDNKECLVNEEGTFEVEREGFSIEPFLYVDNKLITWTDVTCTQTLMDGYLPIPQITWKHPKFEMTIQVFCSGTPGNSQINARYKIKNRTNKTLAGKLFLAVRPFQVNPPWQKLNMYGGVAKLSNISISQSTSDTTTKCIINQKDLLITQQQPSQVGVCKFNNGDIINYLKKGHLPKHLHIKDKSGFASGALAFNLSIQPTEDKQIDICKPFYTSKQKIPTLDYDKLLETMIHYWQTRLDKVHFKVPKTGEKFINSLKSNLAYVLINQDGDRIQPGSRSYLRSWIRDGAMTSSALLRMGNYSAVKDYLNMYSDYLLPEGRVPCAVDDKGAERCPENDSNGEYLYAMLQYYHFTKDKAFLEKHFSTINKAADFILKMIAERKTEKYRNTEFYGLVPESISHEGYSEKPMHSYWDDFFSLKGLKDVAEIARILNKKQLASKYQKAANEFRNNLYKSIQLAMKKKGIDYIPGCAEKGDFDATSTAIALFPCGEYKHLPKAALNATFNKYYQNFQERLKPESNWYDMTPYEVRNCQTFIIMGDRKKAHHLFDFFFTLQRPFNWNHWGEIVFKDAETGRWIGDMPHTWIGSSYINAVRSMFLYEDEDKKALVLGAGIPENWLKTGEPIGISDAPTYYGNLTYSIKEKNGTYVFEASGKAAPPRGFILNLPGQTKFHFKTLPISTNLNKILTYNP